MADAVSAGSISSAVSGLNSALQAASERAASQAGAASKGAAAEEVKEYRQEIRKSPFNNASSAVNLGLLVKNTSRLNALSTLAANDPADFYKFKVVSRGNVTLGQLGDDKGLRVQVMTRTGVVIADSNEKSGSNHDTYKKLGEGEHEMAPGDYVIRVSREAGTDSKAAVNYGLQLRMGNYTRDYDTVARQPRPGDGVPQSSAAQQKLQDMLNGSASFIKSLPPIGTSATQKLMGTLFSGSA